MEGTAWYRVSVACGCASSTTQAGAELGPDLAAQRPIEIQDFAAAESATLAQNNTRVVLALKYRYPRRQSPPFTLAA